MVLYELITTGGTFLLLWWFFYRFTHPYTCTCGYRTWYAGSFKRHMLAGHKWHDK